jgi:competence protein ComEA
MNVNPKRVRAFAPALVLLLGLAVAGAATADLRGVVNVNTASTEELQLLPGVGESRAAAILELRMQAGGFKSVEELAQVKGIGAVALERMRPHVAVKGKTTARVE